MRFAGCFLFTPLLHNLVKWRHSHKWQMKHMASIFILLFFWGGGLRHQISVFVGCVTGIGCGCVGTVRGIALFENVWVHFPNQTHARHSVVILAATEFVWGESWFRGIIRGKCVSERGKMKTCRKRLIFAILFLWCGGTRKGLSLPTERLSLCPPCTDPTPSKQPIWIRRYYI